MTTIAYKDGIIAYDSRMCQGDMIYDDNHEKCVIKDKVRFFISGSFYQSDVLINAYFNNGGDETTDAYALVVDDGEVYTCGINEKGFWRDKETKPTALGTGDKYAIGAMDAGLSAKEAVKIAICRDVYSGGRIRTFKI